MITKQVLEQRRKFFLETSRQNNMRITPQKEEIFMTLAKRNDHPTAQKIFEAVQQKFPSMSFATVYKNLSLLASHNIIHELNFNEGFCRYDAFMQSHHHIYDITTKSITDLVTDENLADHNFPTSLDGKSVKSIQVTYFVES